MRSVTRGCDPIDLPSSAADMSVCIVQDFTFVGKYKHTMQGYALLHDVAVTKHHVVAFQVRYTRKYLHCAAQTRLQGFLGTCAPQKYVGQHCSASLG